ncbi:MAG: hypothetical protein FJ108_04370 [Deltaproteobacteria bacterium]|nr:hypothetical protein [Deltaproteobacteria bacterium]
MASSSAGEARRGASLAAAAFFFFAAGAAFFAGFRAVVFAGAFFAGFFAVVFFLAAISNPLLPSWRWPDSSSALPPSHGISSVDCGRR